MLLSRSREGDVHDPSLEPTKTVVLTRAPVPVHVSPGIGQKLPTRSEDFNLVGAPHD